MSAMLFQLQDAVVSRLGVGIVLNGISWEVTWGETWAVVGANGTGKTTLGELIAGKLRLDSGRVTWPKLVRVKYLPFRENSRLFSPADYYYQQRFEFSDVDDCPTAREYICSGIAGADVELDVIADRMNIRPQLDLKLLKLSNGQTRRARLARALLAKPDLLILDDPYSGLDTTGREELNHTLEAVSTTGTQLILLLNSAAPAWVKHTFTLPKRENQLPPVSIHAPVRATPSASNRPALEYHEVTVQHGGKIILNRVNWTVNIGERWALIGPNGSGKTTLLSLACGDHPAAFGNDVRLFGKRRGTGESIWDVKRQIGIVSPELHQYFTVPMKAWQAAATGFHDNLTPIPFTPEQKAEVLRHFEQFGIAEIAQSKFAQLSTGTQRLVLFIRAIVKQPPLLILDEPFQAMDSPTIARLKQWLETQLKPEQTLILVTHHINELPESITHRITLAAGVVVG